MAISWGEWKSSTTGQSAYSGLRRKRIGWAVTYSPSSPTSATSSISATLKVYLETNWGVDDPSNDLDVGGDAWSHSGSVGIDQDNGDQALIWSSTESIALAYGATTDVDITASLDGINVITGEAVVAGTFVAPKRPYAAPSAPTDVTATRASDTSIALAWDRNATTGAPYTGQSVRVSIDGAASVLVANVSGTATSYNYKAAANHKYVFTVVAANSSGSTSSAASNTILTTPAALASLSAALITSGTIRLTLPKRPTPYTEAQVVITETHNGGADWNAKTTIAMSSLSATATTTWDDTSAETGGTVQYRAVVETTGGTQGTLSSAYKTSNTLVLNTPPLAPTNLTPSGPVDASNTIRLAWTHSPSSDGAAQSSRSIEYSDDSGTSWNSIIAGDTTAAYYDWTPDLGDFTAGQTIVFRVATAGSQPGTYGDWSASQPLTLYGSLAVTLTSEMPPATHDGGPMPVAWTSSPTWGTASQTRYQVTMLDQDSGLTVYDTGMVAGAAESVEIPASVQQDAHTYTVAVMLFDNHQIQSQPASTDVDTDYLEPGPVELAWSYDDESATLVFYPTFDEESSSSLDDTVAWTLERSLDGINWVSVGSTLDPVPVGDSLARVGAVSWYRSVGYTELGIAGEATIVEVPAADVQSRWGWLNFGDGFAQRVRFGWSQTVDISTGRASEVYDIEGGDFPAAVFGDPLSTQYSISGKLLFGSAMPATLATATGEEMKAMSQNAGVCLFRDARGAWFTARVTDMKVSPVRTQTGVAEEAAVSFTVERISI